MIYLQSFRIRRSKPKEVEICNDVPYCKHCNVDDYAHLGFSIEVKRLLGHRNSRDSALVEGLIA